MRKLAAVALLVFALTACDGQDASKTDIDEPEFDGDAQPSDYETRAPDKMTIWLNVDNHPTIVQLCLDGLAFRTVSTTHQNGFTSSVERVPEWDATCAED